MTPPKKIVHERHKKTRKNLKIYDSLLGHLFSDFLSQPLMLIYFVPFLYFVDERRFLV